MSDLIDRAEAISRAVELRMYGKPVKMVAVSELERLPSARVELSETTLPEQADSDELGQKQGETCADVISRQAAMVVIECSGLDDDSKDTVVRVLEQLPSAQRTCVNCGRTINNGGWYADGKTRCPIEEHYALPKDGYCHLWEKRNVTDDDYPERREE